MRWKIRATFQKKKLNFDVLSVILGIEPFGFEPEISDTDQVSEDNNTRTKETTKSLDTSCPTEYPPRDIFMRTMNLKNIVHHQWRSLT